MKKKLIALCLCLTVILSLAGCSRKEDNKAHATQTPAEKVTETPSEADKQNEEDITPDVTPDIVEQDNEKEPSDTEIQELDILKGKDLKESIKNRHIYGTYNANLYLASPQTEYDLNDVPATAIREQSIDMNGAFDVKSDENEVYFTLDLFTTEPVNGISPADFNSAYGIGAIEGYYDIKEQKAYIKSKGSETWQQMSPDNIAEKASSQGIGIETGIKDIDAEKAKEILSKSIVNIEKIDPEEYGLYYETCDTVVTISLEDFITEYGKAIGNDSQAALMMTVISNIFKGTTLSVGTKTNEQTGEVTNIQVKLDGLDFSADYPEPSVDEDGNFNLNDYMMYQLNGITVRGSGMIAAAIEPNDSDIIIPDEALNSTLDMSENDIKDMDDMITE